jgi:hypothetical protein
VATRGALTQCHSPLAIETLVSTGSHARTPTTTAPMARPIRQSATRIGRPQGQIDSLPRRARRGHVRGRAREPDSHPGQRPRRRRPSNPGRRHERRRSVCPVCSANRQHGAGTRRVHQIVHTRARAGTIDTLWEARFAGETCPRVPGRVRRYRLGTSMVRRGSTVRVRQRALKALQIKVNAERAAVVDGFGARFVVTGLVAADLAQPEDRRCGRPWRRRPRDPPRSGCDRAGPTRPR